MASDHRTGPYRTNHAAPRRTEAATDRRITRASALPLGIIAATSFLPFTKTCSEQVTSPLREATSDAPSFLLITPTFASAAVLSVAIVYTYLTKRAATRAALVAVAWSVLASGWIVVQGFAKDAAWPLFLVSAACAPLYGLAWSRRGLARLSMLVDAYLFASFPLAALALVSAEYYGAFLFVFAYATLALMRVIGWIGSWAGARVAAET